MLRFSIFWLSFLTLSVGAQAQSQARDYQSFVDFPALVCDADLASDIAPDFAGPNCRSILFYQADPQDRMLWAQIRFEAEPALLEEGRPLGLFVSAKASSEAFLNGVPIGANGRPGPNQSSEEPGDMDAVFFVPEGTLKPGENRLVIRLSSMNGGITLNSPIHNIALAPYRDPRQPGPATWFALITLGLFVAGFVFFGVRSLRGDDREGSALIAALSLASALQLAAEAARDVMPYPYPLHDLRLSLILTFAIGLGLSFAAYVLLRLFRAYPRRRLLALSALLVVMLAISAFQPGFDLKTSFVLIAALIGAGIAGALAYSRQSNRGALWLALASAALVAAIFWLGGFFLDTVLYLLVAAGLLWLFFKQARGRDMTEGLVADDSAPKRIELTSNGKVEFVDASDIVRFSGAGDYVEVFLSSGRSALYNASLAALEREMSDGFIRVHRSHIVNACCVKSLTRESAGTGNLEMSDGSTVPVSRRNMASVRDALTQA
ncbi:MAG: LytTR family DNA-binding domain-containing protein [Pseudomonadota bacterium]